MKDKKEEYMIHLTIYQIILEKKHKADIITVEMKKKMDSTYYLEEDILCYQI